MFNIGDEVQIRTDDSAMSEYNDYIGRIVNFKDGSLYPYVVELPPEAEENGCDNPEDFAPGELVLFKFNYKNFIHPRILCKRNLK